MMDYLVFTGCGLIRSDAANILPLVLPVSQRGCKQSANLLHKVNQKQTVYILSGEEKVIYEV